jgi:DNA replication ATP-dependent helicase Dna2
VSLSHQYRMNAEIMAISNQLVYGHRLKCGTAAVAERRLALPRHARLKEWVTASEVCVFCTAFGCTRMYCIGHTRGYSPDPEMETIGNKEM